MNGFEKPQIFKIYLHAFVVFNFLTQSEIELNILEAFFYFQALSVDSHYDLLLLRLHVQQTPYK